MAALRSADRFRVRGCRSCAGSWLECSTVRLIAATSEKAICASAPRRNMEQYGGRESAAGMRFVTCMCGDPSTNTSICSTWKP